MAGLGDFFNRFRTQRSSVQPMRAQGVSGVAVIAGYPQTKETNAAMMGSTRWATAADLLVNISIIAASVRYTLNLIARPAWRFEPADDSAEAEQLAEFANSLLDDMDGSWTSTVRRMALYRFNGFGIHEWVAKKRDDGKLGIASLHVRPCHSIDRWDVDESGAILGVEQKRPIDGAPIYLPRGKLVYLVDDSLTDSPEGMGWFRHLAEPANRLKRLLKIEVMGFERDLGGIPVGRAPISVINDMADSQQITKDEAKAMYAGLKSFVTMEAKEPGTGLLLDSQPHTIQGGEGEEMSTVPMWDIDLLTSEQSSIDAIAAAVKRLEFEMALIMGCESLMVGREGEGSRALSEDKSRNLYLLVESTLADMTEAVTRDLLGPVWALNGLPDDLMPKATTEGASFKDAMQIAQVLRDLATAGATLAPDDPAINDLRDLLHVPHAPELSPEERGILMGTAPSPDAQLGLGDDEELDDEPPSGGPMPKPPKGKARRKVKPRPTEGE